jgi:large subunit ribosomal protein L3
MRQLIGQKRGMARIFAEDGEAIGVTVIEAGPCPVVQVKTQGKDGYDALQVGFGKKRAALLNKPQLGHLGDLPPVRCLREVRLNAPTEHKRGDILTVEMFHVGERVDVVGITKGLGFQGSMRRHGFKGGQATHGQSDRLRAPGSIGSSSYPSRVLRGMKMAGRMGNKNLTTRNLTIVAVRPEENLIFLRGAVPGKTNTFLTIREVKRKGR